MKTVATVALISFLISGCTVAPTHLDPDLFRDNAEMAYSKTIQLPADIVASNIDKAGSKCWDSGDIRTKQFKEDQRYVITIGSYGDFTKRILLMADVYPKGSAAAEVKISLLRKGHKEFGDNLIEWADGTTKTCHSPMNKKQG